MPTTTVYIDREHHPEDLTIHYKEGETHKGDYHTPDDHEPDTITEILTEDGEDVTGIYIDHVGTDVSRIEPKKRHYVTMRFPIMAFNQKDAERVADMYRKDLTDHADVLSVTEW